MLAFADQIGTQGAGRGVLNIGGGDVDTTTPIG